MPSPKMNRDAGALACLLCAGERLTESARLSGSDIRALWNALGANIAPNAWDRLSETLSAVLWRCDACGFEFFNPDLAGGSRFYQCLESSDYYSPNRPEFTRTVQFAARQKLSNVLDVGCGIGAFLDMARDAGRRTYGLEFNPSAAAKARAKGHSIFDCLLDQLPKDACPGGFNLITLFQVLEHVQDPVALMRQASARLAPGGVVSVAVPAKTGIYRFLPLDPAQWPPHHISRWSRQDFKTLAARSDLQLVASGGDMLLGSGIEHALRMRRVLNAAASKPPGLQPKLHPFQKWFCLLYRKSGAKFIAPRWGYSIYAYFQKR